MRRAVRQAGGGGAATPPSPAPPHPRASPAGSPSRADPCSGAPRTPPGRAAAWPRPSSSWPQPRSPRAATAFFPLLLLFLLLRAGRPRRGPAQRRLPEHLRRPPRPAPALIARRRRRRGAPGGGGGGAAAGAGGRRPRPQPPLPPHGRSERPEAPACVPQPSGGNWRVCAGSWLTATPPSASYLLMATFPSGAGRVPQPRVTCMAHLCFPFCR